MVIMVNDIVSLYDENNIKKDYKLLFVINKEYKYIVYTGINNNNCKYDLHAVKVKLLDNNQETIPITDDEWKMIEEKYLNFINN